ncbi:MAG: hypothetical protein RR238_10240 [Lachnospiraceae bacterium]
MKKEQYKKIGEDIKSITDDLEQGHLVGKEIAGLKIQSQGHTYKVRTANSTAKV